MNLLQILGYGMHVCIYPQGRMPWYALERCGILVYMSICIPISNRFLIKITAISIIWYASMHISPAAYAQVCAGMRMYACPSFFLHTIIKFIFDTYTTKTWFWYASIHILTGVLVLVCAGMRQFAYYSVSLHTINK